MQNNLYTAALVEDSSGDLHLLKFLLNKHCPNISIIAEGHSITEGISICLEHQPDILFLDLHLGEDIAFSILDYLENYSCKIIFVSSHTEYALKAIEYNANGFLVKPIRPDKLTSTVRRVISFIDRDLNKQQEKEAKFLAVPFTKSIEIIQTDSITHLEADGRYTIFHLLDGTNKMASKNMGEYECLLNQDNFVRIHHKYIVNLKMVKSITKTDGNYCELVNKISLPISKRKLENLQRILKLK